MDFPFSLFWFQAMNLQQNFENAECVMVRYPFLWPLQKMKNENVVKTDHQLPSTEEKGSGNEVEMEQNSIKHPKEPHLLEREEEIQSVCSEQKRTPIQQYKPRKEKKKEGKKPMQSPQRNILPNILHQACTYTRTMKRSQKEVERFFSTRPCIYPIQTMVARFYSYQKLIKEKVNPYVNLKSLKSLNEIQEPECEIFSLSQQKLFLQLTRSLIKYFLENQLNSIALTSIRMKGDSRLWHLQWKRKILQALQNLFSDL